MKRLARILTAIWRLIYWRFKPMPSYKPSRVIPSVSGAMAAGKVEFATLTPMPVADRPRIQPKQQGERQQVVLSDFGITFTFHGSLLAEEYRNPNCPPKRLRLPVIPESDPGLN